jgi:hypothetical protein
LLYLAFFGHSTALLFLFVGNNLLTFLVNCDVVLLTVVPNQHCHPIGCGAVLLLRNVSMQMRQPHITSGEAGIAEMSGKNTL